MWPNAKIGVMGSEQLASVMATVRSSSSSSSSSSDSDNALRDRIEAESAATFSTARLWDD
ncbi:hypothetical protein KEM52_000725, partial [Ascosphaera acerosa]